MGRALPRYAAGTTTRRPGSVRRSSGEDVMEMTIAFGLVASANVAVKVRIDSFTSALEHVLHTRTMKSSNYIRFEFTYRQV